jgi:hypothetical protein
MTKEEATQLLEREGICTIHGIHLTEPDSRNGKFAPFCTRCQHEVEIDRAERINAAKAVLGLY